MGGRHLTKRKIAADIYGLTPIDTDAVALMVDEDMPLEEAHAARNKTHAELRALEDEHAAVSSMRFGLLSRGKKQTARDRSLAEIQGKIAATHDVLSAAQRTLLRAAHARYEDLIKDKRLGFDEIACSQWRADEPDGEPYCHCNKVPGNTLPKDLIPHNESNYLGKPWCPVHQSADCPEPCPMPTLETYLRRFELR